MQYLKQFLAFIFSRQMLAFVATVVVALVVWFVGPLLAVGGLQPLASVGVRVAIIVLLLSLGILWLVSGPFSLVGVTALCLLIWHAGPLLSFGSAQPLAPVWVRTTLVCAIAFVYALYWLYRFWQALRNNDDLLTKFLSFGKGPETSNPAREELKTLSSSMQRAVAQLKTLRTRGGLRRMLEGKRFLYELPWYMIIGSPGAGKTTALRNSGLRFPLAHQMGNGPRSMTLGSAAGTMNCDWWFTNEAVLIDTAGRYTAQDSNPLKDPAEWHGFLGLLRRQRTRAPINGAIVALDAAEILRATPAERTAHASLLRTRLVELRHELGIRFPVYVIVTKMDVLHGFADYFQSLTTEGRTQIWGFTLPYVDPKAERPGDAASERESMRTQVEVELTLLKDRLAAGLRARLNEVFDPERRRSLFALPQEFAGLATPLAQVLEEAFLDSRFDSTQWHSGLRGVYFTSGAQSESFVPADPDTLFERLWRSLRTSTVKPARTTGTDAASMSATAATSSPATDADPAAAVANDATASTAAPAVPPEPAEKANPNQRPGRIDTTPRAGQQGFFLQDVFAKVIFPESHLVRPNLGWEVRFRVLRLLGHALVIVIFLWLAGALALSFRNNSDYLAAVSARTQALGQRVGALFAKFSPTGVPDVLNSARELPAYAGLDVDNPPGSLLYGLYSVPPVLGVSAQTYAQLQESTLLPPILTRMEAVLNQSLSQRDAKTAYETLRVYKLLHDQARYMQDGGASDVRHWVLKDWETTDSAAVFGGRASMVGHVEALFSGARPVQSASLPNEALVREVQTFLGSNTSTQRIYERAKAAMLPEAPQAFTLVRAVGPQVGTVFSRVDSQPLERGVPGLFTYDGYHDLFDKRLAEFVGGAVADDAWVMGAGTGAPANGPLNEDARKLQVDSLLQDIRRQYLTEYAAQWETFLDSIRTVSGSGITGASLGFDLTVVRQFAAPDSPLARLARAAARETTLSRPLVTRAEEDKSLLDKATDALNKQTTAIGKNLGIRPEERMEKQLVDDRFAALREVVTGQPDVSLGALGVAAAKPGMEAISGLVNEFYTLLVVADTALTAGSLPPGGAEVGARLKLEAGKLPAPFREVLTALATSGGDKVVQGSTDILRKQAQTQLDRINGLLALQVSEPCRRGLEGRYPLAPAAQDASMEDFSLMFASGGAADDFFNKNLAQFVDTSVRPWRYKSPSSLNAVAGVEATASGAAPAPVTNGPTMLGELLKLLSQSGPNLDSFYRAQQIRELFFRDDGGKKLNWKTDIRVTDLDASVTDLIIDIDGQGERYVHGPVIALTVNWPGPRGGSMAELTADPRVSVATSSVLTSGPWALFHLLDKGHLVGTATPGRMSIEYNFDGRKAVLDINSGSQPNPLNSDVLKGFHCPGRSS